MSISFDWPKWRYFSGGYKPHQNDQRSFALGPGEENHAISTASEQLSEYNKSHAGKYELIYLSIYLSIYLNNLCAFKSNIYICLIDEGNWDAWT